MTVLSIEGGEKEEKLITAERGSSSSSSSEGGLDVDEPYFQATWATIGEYIFGVLNAVCFIVGSLLWFPQWNDECGVHSCMAVAAVFFVLGSTFLILTFCAILSSVRASKMENTEVYTLLYTSIGGSFLLLLGSCLFFPGEGDGPQAIGLVVFVLGCCVFGYTGYRDFKLNLATWRSGAVSDSLGYVLAGTSLCYFIGSFIFFIGEYRGVYSKKKRKESFVSYLCTCHDDLS